ncbi:MAG: hypothetical protein JWM98_2060 [Thermoleophilia bacterium]|nr:hypothetical protein [Thermoleophilia bacterium]
MCAPPNMPHETGRPVAGDMKGRGPAPGASPGKGRTRMGMPPLQEFRVIQYSSHELLTKGLDLTFDSAGSMTKGVASRSAFVPVLLPLPPGFGAFEVPLVRNGIDPAKAGVQQLGAQLRAAAGAGGMSGPFQKLEQFRTGMVIADGTTTVRYRLPGTNPPTNDAPLPEAPQGIVDALRIAGELRHAA